MLGCPIRKSPDQRSFAPTRSLSQLITSFIASVSLGIRHTPLVTFYSPSGTYMKYAPQGCSYFQLYLEIYNHSTKKRNEMSYFTVLLVSISQRTMSMQQNAWSKWCIEKVKMADLNRCRAGLEPYLPFYIWNISECVAKKGNPISLSQKSVSNNIRY